MQMNWVKKGAVATGRPLRPGEEVQLRSEQHIPLTGSAPSDAQIGDGPPPGYQVLELVPKTLRKWLDNEIIRIPYLEAKPDVDSNRQSRFWSELFGMPDPRHEKRPSTFVAKFLPEYEMQSAFVAPEIHCGHLYIEKVEHEKQFTARLRPHIRLPKIGLSLFNLGSDWGSRTTKKAYAAIDPDVDVSILQGERLSAHLIEVAERFASEIQPADDYPELLATSAGPYFLGEDLPVRAEQTQATIDVDAPLWIEIDAPASASLRRAFSVVLTDLKTGSEVISDPVFLTAISGDIVGTDVPASLLTEQSQRILTELAGVRGDVQSLSYRLSEQIGDVWAQIVEATAELGVAGVQEAMSFVSYELLPA
jgi:hypothetical protein